MEASERQEVRLSVTPEEGTTVRYATASGDTNPIHLDDTFAQSVGLPGRILHGLWTAAQVARAAQSVAPEGALLAGPDGPVYALESLDVTFRGMGMMGSEIVVSGTASEAEDGRVELALGAAQGSTRLIRGARARVRTR